MPQSLDALIARIDALLEEFVKAEADHRDVINAVAEEHRSGAINLVHYTTLRHHDRRELQNDLMDIGVTSLTSAEANVWAKVNAARDVLAALRGDAGPWDLDATNHALDQGDQILEANSTAIFGPTRHGRPTRIMVTLPSEAGGDPSMVGEFVAAGMDIARINCAHDDPATWAHMVDNVRAAAATAERQVLVSMDLPGPKLRTGPIADGPPLGRAQVTRDDTGQMVTPARLWLTSADPPSRPPVQTQTSAHPALTVVVDPTWLAARAVGDEVTFDDIRGRSRTFTVTLCADDGVLAESDRSAYLTNGTELTSTGDTTAAGALPPVVRRLTLTAGDQLVLTTDLTPVALPDGDEVAHIGCTLPEAIDAIDPGDAVLLDDGAIGAVAESVAAGEVTLRITRTKPGGHRLGAQKGINLPDTVLALPAMTTDDEAQLPFIAGHADLVAVSFIRTPDDVRHVLDRLAATNATDLGLVLKIETRQGFENLPSVLLAAMQHPRVAVMIARGDLAVEVGFERLSEVPLQILALCEAAHVPCIWATQVLESLAQTGQPSRAEIIDAATGQRADCVMLNKGPHVVAAIRTLDDILTRLYGVQRKSRTLMRHIHSWDAQ